MGNIRKIAILFAHISKYWGSLKYKHGNNYQILRKGISKSFHVLSDFVWWWPGLWIENFPKFGQDIIFNVFYMWRDKLSILSYNTHSTCKIMNLYNIYENLETFSATFIWTYWPMHWLQLSCNWKAINL